MKIVCQMCRKRVERRSDAQKYCPSCSAERQREHKARWLLENPYYVRGWYLKNYERLSERHRLWRLKHPEYSREYSRRWRLKNPQRSREINRKKGAKLQQLATIGRAAIELGLIKLEDIAT